MKNCPFCGEEIQDTAKKCKHCKEWIRFKTCSACGESVPENSEVCPCCDEPFSNNNEEIHTEEKNNPENENKEPIKEQEQIAGTNDKKVTTGNNEQSTETTGNKDNPEQPKKNKNIFKELWDGYNGFIIVILLILVWSIRPSKSSKNENNQYFSELSSKENITYSSNSNNLNDSLSANNKAFTIVEDKSKDYQGEIKYKLSLEGTTGGYILSNNLYSCFIDSNNIKEFTTTANRGENITSKLCTPIYNEGKDTKNIFIAIDNTYAYDEYQNLDKTGPENRIKNLQKRLNEYKNNNLDLSLGFIYTTKPAGLAETVNEDIIRFRIQNDSDNINIKVYKTNDGVIQFNNRKIYYNNLSFGLDNEIEDCKESNSALYKYDCRNIDALYNKIKTIYEKDYKNGSHSGNALIEYFSSPYIKELLNTNEHIYLFTDGQFELTENQDNLKKQAKQMINYNMDYPISNFSLNSFTKYTTQFKNFRNNNIISKSKFGNIDCSNTSIRIIGLIGKNNEFTEYAQDFYKNKMFTGCSVDFPKLY